jgi:CubicO group peptidase (beta-lactamase class C family)
MLGVLASNRVPGAVVSYIKNGEVAWTKAFGVANLQTGLDTRAQARIYSLRAKKFAQHRETQ